MKKYIMNSEEYDALDKYLYASKASDNGVCICQMEPCGDFGVYCDDEEVVSLKELIRELFIEGYPEELIGYKGFVQEDIDIINTLYNKLEDCDKKDLPEFRQAIEYLGWLD